MLALMLSPPNGKERWWMTRILSHEPPFCTAPMGEHEK